MKAPKEIYVPLVDMGIEDGGIQPAAIWWNKDKSTEKQDCKGAVKYVRADLAELTWEDCAGIMDAFFDFMQDITAERETSRHSKEELYKEVLRRFLENKKATRL